MSDAPARKPAESPARGSLSLRGRRVVRYLLGFVAVILVVDAIVGDKGLVSLLKARRDFTSVEQALQRARRENVEAREQARRLREDPSAIEELARRELGLIKPDEILLIIRDVEPKK